MLEHKQPMIKDVGTQTGNTLFELLDHDCSLYHSDYSKNIIILESEIEEYSTDSTDAQKLVEDIFGKAQTNTKTGH